MNALYPFFDQSSKVLGSGTFFLPSPHDSLNCRGPGCLNWSFSTLCSYDIVPATCVFESPHLTRNRRISC
uniref:Uncharacterized protein n=1 Tax=Rhizophora mucronata TaxID=61149 RepID=A0A2P2NUR8_RHIMU